MNIAREQEPCQAQIRLPANFLLSSARLFLYIKLYGQSDDETCLDWTPGPSLSSVPLSSLALECALGTSQYFLNETSKALCYAEKRPTSLIDDEKVPNFLSLSLISEMVSDMPAPTILMSNMFSEPPLPVGPWRCHWPLGGPFPGGSQLPFFSPKSSI